MRILLILAFVTTLAAPSRAGESSRQLVAQLAAPAGADGALAARPRDTRASALARLAPRLAALGLTATRALTDGLGAAPLAARAGHGVHPAFVFDPERVVLLEARDSLGAASALAALAGDGAFDWVEPNRSRLPQVWSLGPAGAATAPMARTWVDSLPNDPMLRSGDQYGLYNPGPSGPYGGRTRADVHAMEAWRIGVGSFDVRVAIADTGVDPDHPELAGGVSTNGPRIVDPFNATDDGSGSVRDLYGHGTPVAGVAVAQTNNGSPLVPGRGVAGVLGGDSGGNPGCRWVPIKISPGFSGEASSWDIARAVLHATRVGARAMNLSYASDGPSRLEREALHWGLVHGCVVVAAAGNQGFNFPTLAQYPAAYAAEGLCIQVGASDWNDERAVFSSYGPGLDFLAPGFVVWTTFMTYPSHFGAVYDGYVQASGTSFAAPFGTGAVGLLAAERPELTDTDFQNVLRESADDLGAPGRDAPTGWGRLNLARALEAVSPAMGVWHDEVAAEVVARGPVDTLVIGERGSGGLDRWRGRVPAERLEVRATVTVPDSFTGAWRVWPRVGGTMAARGDFQLPWWTPHAEVIARTARTFTLRGWLYRLVDCGGCEDDVLPLPADQARFAFTVLGEADHAPRFEGYGVQLARRAAPPGNTSASEVRLPFAPGDSLTVSWTASDDDTIPRVRVSYVDEAGRTTLAIGGASGQTTFEVPCTGRYGAQAAFEFVAYDDRGRADSSVVSAPVFIAPSECAPVRGLVVSARPNPFRGALQLSTPARGELRVLDAAGRRVRTLAPGSVTWDGRDDRGRDTPPGLYFVRWSSLDGNRVVRVVKLGG